MQLYDCYAFCCIFLVLVCHPPTSELGLGCSSLNTLSRGVLELGGAHLGLWLQGKTRPKPAIADRMCILTELNTWRSGGGQEQLAATYRLLDAMGEILQIKDERSLMMSPTWVQLQQALAAAEQELGQLLDHLLPASHEQQAVILAAITGQGFGHGQQQQVGA